MHFMTNKYTAIHETQVTDVAQERTNWTRYPARAATHPAAKHKE